MRNLLVILFIIDVYKRESMLLKYSLIQPSTMFLFLFRHNNECTFLSGCVFCIFILETALNQYSINFIAAIFNGGTNNNNIDIKCSVQM